MSSLSELPQQPPATAPPPPLARDARDGVRVLTTRWFFSGMAAIAAVAGALYALLPQGLALDRRLAVVGAHAALAAVSLLATRVQRGNACAAMLAVSVLAALVTAATSLLLGWGLAAPCFAFFGLLVCLLAAAATRGLGLWLAAVEMLLLAAVAAWSPAGVAGDVAGTPNDALRLALHLLMVVAGVAGGVLLSSVVARYLQAADDREQRFRGLLAIAADAYWEIDQHYRLLAISNQRDGDERQLSASEGLGELPWELPQFDADGDVLDALLADLGTRVPFRDRPVLWRRAVDGTVRHFSVSGEPRFDGRGIFKGYWGVARDVTDDVLARQSLAATETRYQELFASIPTPLVLHRDARVIDANPAALALFGHADLGRMNSQDLLAAYESGDSRERARRRFDELATLPTGAALPVADFRLLLQGGRRLSVRATAVRVEADGGPAALSIFVDDTERRAAEEAVRRSEAMLSHLVATSPDVITLTDLATGRCTMVNRTFEQLTGYGAAEVVGKTVDEMGLWQRREEHERFTALLQQQGKVVDMPVAFRAKGGEARQMLASGALFAMDRREYLVVTARDVSHVERNRLEREAILQNASIGIAVTRASRFVLVNPHFEQVFGWQPGELLERDIGVVWPGAPAQAEFIAATRAELLRGDQVELERTMLRKDAGTFLARIRGKAIDPMHASGGTLWIVEDVTQRRLTDQALADARDAAEAASRAKSAFLANTSHELRTPLNGILHLAQLAREPALDAERRDQYLEQIVDSAQSLAGIISDILDLSKIEAGKLHVEAVPFDLGDLLRTVQRGYATLASARELAMELEVGPDIGGPVLGDPLRVRQILGNYLSNALKFTDSGRVRIVAHRADGGRSECVRLEVHDSGVGIDAEAQARLFRPFTQADQSTTRRFGGTGLGLSICRELALLMGGNVGVDSAPGAGSVFWAELPLPPAAAPGTAAEATAVPAAPRSLAGVRVLMAEDNAVNMLIAVALLERWGVQVEQAADGRQAVDAVAAAAAAGRPFDAVLMDVQMPVMSGYEATRAVRSSESADGGAAGRRLPIIALTAAALVGERQAALDAGMDDFLTKPIDAEKLRDALVRWTGGSRTTADR